MAAVISIEKVAGEEDYLVFMDQEEVDTLHWYLLAIIRACSVPYDKLKQLSTDTRPFRPNPHLTTKKPVDEEAT